MSGGRQAADAACRSGLAPLGFSSLDDVSQNLNLSGRLKKDLNYTGRVPNQGPWGCNFEDLSENLQYELLDCDEGRVVVFGRYRAFRVFRLEDGKQIMDLKVPRSTLFGGRRVLFSGVLATRAESPMRFCYVMAPNWKATGCLRVAQNAPQARQLTLNH